MRKVNYTAKELQPWAVSMHYDGPLGKAICGRSSKQSTDKIELVNCKLCLDKMLKGKIIDEETYNSEVYNL